MGLGMKVPKKIGTSHNVIGRELESWSWQPDLIRCEEEREDREREKALIVCGRVYIFL
jgi:hypothetical protein